MKKMRKMLSVLLIIAMFLTLITPVYASETKYTITINNAKTGHVYEAYQIFSGDLSEGVLSNVDWGNGITESGRNALMKKYGTKTAAATAEKISKAADAAEFSKEVGASGNLAKHTDSTFGGGKYTITSLNAGYYLVKDQEGSLTGHDAYTGYIIQVVGDVSLAPKSSMPTIEKKVKDIDDSTDNVITDNPWQDSADFDINDHVPFLLKATLGNTIADYTSYKLVFHDTVSAGLTYDSDSIKVSVGSKVLSKDAYAVEASGGSLKVTVNDVIAQGASKVNNIVTVEYTATLNNNAVIAREGNANSVYLEYSNNPNNPAGGDMGQTNPDVVKVFTYELTVNKTDGKSALEGAAFKLFKYTNGSWNLVGEEKSGGTTFKWKGLDDGKYKLSETKTPAGYNSIKDIEFTISAVHDTESENPMLTSVKADGLTDGTVTGEGSISVDIVNQSGATLPETGGSGNTLFYVLGGALVIFAGVLLVAKRRIHQ